jgi:hypothetical protein
LYTKLRELYITQDGFLEAKGVEFLTKLFAEKEVHKEGKHRDGYRLYVLNVCHLLDVKCCFNCDKNSAPKFGGIEFRGLDPVAGEDLRLTLMLLQRTVQFFCTENMKTLHKWITYNGTDRVDIATEYLQELGITNVGEWTGFPAIENG